MLFHTIVLFHKSSLYKKQLTGGVLLIRSSKEICKSFKKIPAPVSFLIKFQAAFQTEVFFCEFQEIFKKIFFAEDLRTTAFGFLKCFWNINHFTWIFNNYLLCNWPSFSSLLLCGARERKSCKHDSRKRINFRLCLMFVFYIV